MLSGRKIARVGSIVIILLLIVLYTVYQVRPFSKGPQLEIVHPPVGFISNTSLLEMTGVTEHIADITLNGQAIFVDEEGSFTETVLLHDGYNAITVWVRDRFGRERIEQVEVVYR